VYWSRRRTASWCAGSVAAAAALFGPVAAAAHHSFTAHMAGHLLLGMAAPLLLVLAAPVSLALRALPSHRARTLAHLLRTPVVRVLTHPVVAALLNAGGLWALYTTGLYQQMSENHWLHLLVHAHLLVSGYLFTAATIGVDPAPHRPGRWPRAVVLIGFLAAHDILAKHLYARPPMGVSAAQAHAGAELMYYGGDLIDVVLIAIFCWQWYTRPEERLRRPSIELGGEPGQQPGRDPLPHAGLGQVQPVAAQPDAVHVPREVVARGDA
jgi:putative membrane protein